METNTATKSRERIHDDMPLRVLRPPRRLSPRGREAGDGTRRFSGLPARARPCSSLYARACNVHGHARRRGSDPQLLALSGLGCSSAARRLLLDCSALDADRTAMTLDGGTFSKARPARKTSARVASLNTCTRCRQRMVRSSRSTNSSTRPKRATSFTPAQESPRPAIESPSSRLRSRAADDFRSVGSSHAAGRATAHHRPCS